MEPAVVTVFERSTRTHRYTRLMVSRASLTLVASVAIALLTSGSLAQNSGDQTPPSKEPKPHEPLPTDPAQTVSAEPAAGQWQLEFKLGELRLFKDPESGVAYWYLTYKVVNRTGQDRWWGPKFEMLDDGGRLLRSGRSVPVIISKRVEALLGNRLVEDQYQILGEIHQGEANAKEGVVVWPAEPATATELHVFVRGISSEMKAVTDPKSGETQNLHKSLKCDFRVAGDPKARGAEPVPCELQQWIMR